VHKEFVPEEKKTINAEFYNAVMDCLLKRIHWVCPAAFCCRDFFLLYNNAPVHMVASVCQFLTPKKCYSPLVPPYSPDLYPPDYFMFLKSKNEVKRTPLRGCCCDQEAITHELKKVQKEGSSAAFHKLYNRAKACVYANGPYF
jgi:hypothetical protein